jgi:hypothetical protein
MEAGHYVIIPATFETGMQGNFLLAVYAEDSEATLSHLTQEWAHAPHFGVFQFILNVHI